MTNLVYIAKNIETGQIKIGCSADVECRVASLGYQVGAKVELLHTVEGGFPAERQIHRFLRDQPVSNEWYEPTDRVKNFIELLLSTNPGGPFDSKIPDINLADGDSDLTAADLKAEMRRLLRLAALPIQIDDTRQAQIRRAVGVTGLGWRRAKSIWYDECHTIEAHEYFNVKRRVKAHLDDQKERSPGAVNLADIREGS